MVAAAKSVEDVSSGGLDQTLVAAVDVIGCVVGWTEPQDLAAASVWAAGEVVQEGSAHQWDVEVRVDGVSGPFDGFFFASMFVDVFDFLAEEL